MYYGFEYRELSLVYLYLFIVGPFLSVLWQCWSFDQIVGRLIYICVKFEFIFQCVFGSYIWM